MNKSIWEDGLKLNKIKELKNNIKTDILIIGGGITGISIAYELQNYNVVLVESNRIGFGVTKNTTGKINYLQETIYADLTKKYSLEIAKKYLNSQVLAIKRLKEIVNKENINCNLKQVESFVFTSTKKEIKKIKQEKMILEKLGVKVKEYHNQDNFKYAISVKDTYTFHPLKYVYSLKNILEKKIKIYENTKVIKLEKENDNYIVYTNNYKIMTKKVIIATHYPYFTLPFIMPLKVNIEKSLLMALKTNKTFNKTYITSKNPCLSIRYFEDKEKYLIILKNSHNISNHLNNLKNYHDFLSEINKKNISYIWENTDLITVDKMPYIGLLKRNDNNLLIATGFNTWGMTNSVLSSLIIKDIILNKDNEYINLFSPLRTNNIKYIKDYLKNIYYNAKSFLINKLFKNKKWYQNKVIFMKKNGTNIAIYNDGKEKHIVYSTCPHLGCTLIFNEFNKTWDCPCHASKFSIEGKVLKGPSTKDITYKE